MWLESDSSQVGQKRGRRRMCPYNNYPRLCFVNEFLFIFFLWNWLGRQPASSKQVGVLENWGQNPKRDVTTVQRQIARNCLKGGKQQPVFSSDDNFYTSFFWYRQRGYKHRCVLIRCLKWGYTIWFQENKNIP